MKNIDVLYFIEHKDRELGIASEIKKKLKEENISTVILSIVYHPFYAMIHYKPKVILMPYCTSVRSPVAHIFSTLYGEGVKIINMNYEQIINNYFRFLKRPSDDFTKNKVIQLCWGKSMAEYYEKEKVKKENIFITGRPERILLNRLNYDKENIRSIIIKKHKKLTAWDKWYFFPLDDNFVFLDGLISKEIKKGVWEENKILAYKDFLSKTVFKFVDWICQLYKAEWGQDMVFIIRPHPGVTVEVYEKLFKERIGGVPEFVYLTRDYTVKEWVVASNACFSNYSTVLLDALSIGKPSYLIYDELIDNEFKMDWFDDMKKITTYQEFCSKLEHCDSYTSDIINKYIDCDKDGIEETVKIISISLRGENKESIQFSNVIKCVFFCFSSYIKPYIRAICFKMHIKLFLTNGQISDYIEPEDS